MARTSKDEFAEEVADEAAPDAEVKPNHQGAGRPNDVKIVDALHPNSTFASRRKAREASVKRVAEAQNKAVTSADSK
jgi:hypothetical protein